MTPTIDRVLASSGLIHQPAKSAQVTMLGCNNANAAIWGLGLNLTASSLSHEHQTYDSIASSHGEDPTTTRLWRRVAAMTATSAARVRDMEQSHTDEVKRIKSKYRAEIAELEKQLLARESIRKQAYEEAAVEGKQRREAESTIDRLV